jgi:Fe-coproporphyrin III synthase
LIDSFQDNQIYRLNSLKIKITEKCNLRCRMCNYWNVDHQVEELSTKKVLDIIDEASAIGCKIITFSGGEATLRKDLEEIFARVKEHKMSMSLFSNGVGISSHRLNSLVTSGINKISVSIDSPEPEKHDSIRGVKGAFQKSTEFVRNCVALKQADSDLHKVTIATCLTRSNVHNLSDMVRLVKQLGADMLTIIKTEVRVEEGVLLVLTADEEKLYQKQILPDLKQMCRDNNIQFSSSGISEHFGLCAKTELQDLPCYYVWENATITANGDVYPCCDLLQSPRALLGNVKQMKLLEILNSDQAVNIRSLISKRLLPVCGQCFTKDDYNRRIHKIFCKYGKFAGVNK